MTQEIRPMTETDARAAQQPTFPAPTPALRQFDRFIGRWGMKGRTIGSEVNDVVGTASYARLPGGRIAD